jgi:hypothetical protein
MLRERGVARGCGSRPGLLLAGATRGLPRAGREVRKVFVCGPFASGPWRTRTSNLGIKSPLLYQLS